jgi:hypothetical protein
LTQLFAGIVEAAKVSDEVSLAGFGMIMVMHDIDGRPARRPTKAACKKLFCEVASGARRGGLIPVGLSCWTDYQAVLIAPPSFRAASTISMRSTIWAMLTGFRRSEKLPLSGGAPLIARWAASPA